MSKEQAAVKARQIADAAIQLPASDRAAFIEAETQNDAELRRRVHAHLAQADTADRSDQSLLSTGGALRAVPGLLDELRPDLTGQTLGRYTLVKEIGRGGMGVVYEAKDEQLQRTVAVKVLPAQDIDDHTRERFLREARAAAALNHPNIVAIFDAGEAEGRPYLVMEFVPGASLDREPPQQLDEALEVACQVCDALEHAHGAGLVHRDLKPGNILVAKTGDKLTAKLTDMGIALARGDARVTGTGVIAGTPTHMAPEQALGQPVDGRADLYSLGVMLYAWGAGRPPFDGDDALAIVSQHIHAPVVPPRTYQPDLPPGLEPLILSLLSKAPTSRPAGAAEVRAALESVVRGATDELQGSDGQGVGVAIEGLARGRMIGRQEELQQLQQIWHGAVAREGGVAHLALISGEPGVGKTRLAYEVMATAQIDRALALTGGCYENEATTPYLPFVEAFQRLVHERDDAALAEALGDSASEIARLAPEIESRLGPFPQRQSLEPQEERLRLFDHTARFLRRLAKERGLLFFVDDLQWADHGSLALLHYLLRQLSSDRVFFLATYREVELDRAHPLSRSLVDWNRERLATRVRLDRLGKGDTARMVSTLLGQQDVSEEFVVSLHHETEGNPFFVEEIVKAMIADGGLVRRDDAWRRVSDEFMLPQSVKSAIGSRLARVSDACTDLLRTAAVLGKLFDFEELTATTQATPSMTEDALLDALDEATAAQLIAPRRGESFAFTHDKIREVLYDELNPIRRRRLHIRVAEGLERLFDSGTQVTVEDLAHHFMLGGDLERGLKYALAAAESAHKVFAYDEALQMLHRARECAEALEQDAEVARVDAKIGDVAYERGDVKQAAETYEQTLLTVQDSSLRNILRCRAGRAYVTGGDPRGLKHVEQALDELSAEDDPLWMAEAMNVRGRYAHIAGELQRAVDLYRPAIELAKPLGNPELMVRLYSNLAGSLQHQAQFEESDDVARLCREIGKAERLPKGEMLGYEFLSENALYRGEWKKCIRAGEAEQALAEAVHANAHVTWSRFRAFALEIMGRFEEAEAMFRLNIEATQQTGDRRLELFMRSGLAILHLHQGDSAKALSALERIAKTVDEAGLLGHRIFVRGNLVQTLLAHERYDDAAAAARLAIDLWQSSGSQGNFLIHGTWFVEALVHAGDTQEARRVLEVHGELSRRTGAEHRLAQNLRAQGLLDRREGRDAEARTHLEAAAEKFEACESAVDLGLVRKLLAQQS